MNMEQKEIDNILKKYKDVFDALEEYDRIRELPELTRKLEKPTQLNL